VVCSSLVEVEGPEDLEAYYQEVGLWEVLDQEVGLGMAVNTIYVRTALKMHSLQKY
jgi:hypothetical protein